MKKKSYILFMGLLVSHSLFGQTLSLQGAIEEALLHNQQQAITEQDRAIAKAKYQQALSADLPSLDLSLSANRRDEAFIDETKTMFQIPGFGSIPVSYTHQVMGRDTQVAKAQMTYALYTGGKISAYQKQAQAGMDYAKEASALTESGIILNVRKYYAGVILAQKLEDLMRDSVMKMRVTYELTEAFYKGASMKVKKTDYLRAKTTLLNMQSMLLSFENASKLAKSALCFEMGKGESCDVEVDEASLLQSDLEDSLQAYYEKLFTLNHQLKQSKIGLEAKEAGIEIAQSGYLPTMALYANAQSLHNNEHGGIINSQNNDSWNIGAVINYNLFSGGKTTAKVQEAKAQKLKVKAQQAYLKSGLKLQAKKAYLNVKAADAQVEVMKEALKSAEQNSDLNLRAYKEEMVETKDVLESQFIRSLTAAALYKAEYDAAINRAELDYTVGEALQ
jgi:outer membrane protein TolC